MLPKNKSQIIRRCNMHIPMKDVKFLYLSKIIFWQHHVWGKCCFVSSICVTRLQWVNELLPANTGYVKWPPRTDKTGSCYQELLLLRLCRSFCGCPQCGAAPYRDCFLDLRLFNSLNMRRLGLCYCCQAWTLETVLGGNTALTRWWTARSIDADAKR